ncbi:MULTISPECIES: S24 family peptidase [unclassified Neisseria]|uniref:S24 family peptidase n=1 Tax=unclassified Neisseria TaxID=2623750 RepID=UPI002666F205|nr:MULTISPECIES: S24 family peptidase [unclassified Neisseria]MDO1508769.1 S24 family peptidase [Neisseria sp. MVDL19-042950]MDO1515028.1 S24 family peptidase [Neisseria sp. MVDL18-041461]MDO1562388.1 S24 family peptidase [Neisseria sp. MVDL20-010259]
MNSQAIRLYENHQSNQQEKQIFHGMGDFGGLDLVMYRPESDCMKPAILKSDVVGLLPCESYQGCGVYLVMVRGIDEPILRRVARSPKGFHLICDNELYQSDIAKPDDVAFLGRVKRLYRLHEL